MNGIHNEVPNGMREFDKKWRKQGGTVRHVRRTGEKRYTHPALPQPIAVNGRRRDVPRKLRSAMRRIMMRAALLC